MSATNVGLKSLSGAAPGSPQFQEDQDFAWGYLQSLVTGVKAGIELMALSQKIAPLLQQLGEKERFAARSTNPEHKARFLREKAKVALQVMVLDMFVKHLNGEGAVAEYLELQPVAELLGKIYDKAGEVPESETFTPTKIERRRLFAWEFLLEVMTETNDKGIGYFASQRQKWEGELAQIREQERFADGKNQETRRAVLLEEHAQLASRILVLGLIGDYLTGAEIEIPQYVEVREIAEYLIKRRAGLVL